MTAEQTASCTFWVQVVPVWSRYWPEHLDRLKIVRTTQRKPREAEPGCVLVKLTIRLPAAAFIPRTLQAEVTVPEGSYLPVPVVEVEQP